MRSQDSSLPNLKFSDDPLMIRVGCGNWPFLKRERSACPGEEEEISKRGGSNGVHLLSCTVVGYSK